MLHRATRYSSIWREAFVYRNVMAASGQLAGGRLVDSSCDLVILDFGNVLDDVASCGIPDVDAKRMRVIGIDRPS
jgi:hypothetical protein